jgi:hypothetical protein
MSHPYINTSHLCYVSQQLKSNIKFGYENTDGVVQCLPWTNGCSVIEAFKESPYV